MAYMPASSKEELRVPYARVEATAFPVQIAIVLEGGGEPADDAYHDAVWVGQDAVLVIGAGSDVELEPGLYAVWTRITTATQRPVRRSGQLTVGDL